MKFRTFLLAAMLMLGGAVCALAQSTPDPNNQQPSTPDNPPQPQSLADVARADRAAATKKASHVFTNDDVQSSDSASKPKDGDSADAAKPDDKSGDAADDKSGDSKKAPPEDSIQVKGAKKIVEAKTVQIDAVTDEQHKLEYDLANAKTPEEASSIAQSIRNLQHNLEVWKNVRDDAQKVIDAANKPKPQQDQQSQQSQPQQ